MAFDPPPPSFYKSSYRFQSFVSVSVVVRAVFGRPTEQKKWYEIFYNGVWPPLPWFLTTIKKTDVFLPDRVPNFQLTTPPSLEAQQRFQCENRLKNTLENALLVTAPPNIKKAFLLVKIWFFLLCPIFTTGILAKCHGLESESDIFP